MNNLHAIICIEKEGGIMARNVFLLCPECGARAIIKKTIRSHALLSYRYCSCNDPECGLTFRLREEFDKVLSPSAKGLERLNEHCKSKGTQLHLEVMNPV